MKFYLNLVLSPPVEGETRDVREFSITSDNREVFIALSSLIRAGHHEMALVILDNELGGGC